MTSLRPEREDLYGGERPYEPYGGAPYADPRTAPPPPASGEPTVVLPPVGDQTAVLPPVSGEQTMVLPPVSGDQTAVLPPVTGESTVVLSRIRPAAGGDEQTMALRLPLRAPAAPTAPPAAGTPAGGRAARRKAAKRRGGRHSGPENASPASPASSAQPARRPLSRVEARRQARLAKPGPAVIASRVIGEVFITTGVLMLLFVTYQLWWTNIRAHAQAGNETHQLQDDWANGRRNPGVFEPGQGFAILHIPKLDVVAPIAEGVSKEKVLDKGMVGHYGEPPLKTAMPDAKTGNFGLAAHRNTHGEPFRYINRLVPGDAVVVETQDTYFVYKVTSTLPVTSPANTSVLDPVPKGSGFTKPGRYITLTTCTPEFTSTYRLIVWGKMVEERPRSKGKPDALIE
ncbi:class E sortase [Streptomyces sp. NPDC001606]